MKTYKLYMMINSLAGGGAERVAVRLLDVLKVERVFLLERDINYETQNEKLVFLSNHRNITNSAFKTFYVPIYAMKLKREISKDCKVVSFLERANYVNILSSFLTGHSAIISIRMSQLMGRKRMHPYNLLNRILYPKAKLIVCISKGIASELKKHYRVSAEKIRVVYNPVDIKYIKKKVSESVEDYQVIFENPTLITVGRLTKQKGQWYLLRIFKELKKKFSELKLVILGEGELKDYLVSLSEELGLRTYDWDRDKLSGEFDVYFLGFQSNPFKFMVRSKLFVFPSLWEGFGNVLVEAMACGVPVVSADCRSGPREILAPDTDPEYQTREPEFAEYGILMPVFEVKFKTAKEPMNREEKMWAELLSQILKNEEMLSKYIQKAKDRARHFDIEIIAKQWKELLNEKCVE